MNDLRAVLPPGYSDRAVASSPAVRNYDLRIPVMYSNKNPSWQQLTINEADVLEPEVFMPRLNPNEIFQPEPDDVALLEREVNAYRSNAYDDELEELQRQRRLLLEQMQDVHNDDLEDQLNDLNNRIRIRQQELEDFKVRQRMIEEENRKIELELQRTIQPPQRIVVQQIVAPPPRPVVVERPARATSPRSMNILPNMIDKLPPQVNSAFAYGYVDGIQVPIMAPGSNLNGSTVIGGIQYNNQFRALDPAGNIIQAQNGGYTRPSTYTVNEPTRMQVNQVSSPIRTSGYGTSGPGYQVTSGFQPPVQQANPYATVSSAGLRTSAGVGAPAGVSGGAVYKINGQTYTNETLPAQYAHLRR